MKARTSDAAISQPDEGSHFARLVGIVDLGHQPGFEWQGKEVKSAYKLRLTYELPASLMDDGRPHWVHEDVTNSDNEKSTLSSRVRSLKGSFTNLTAMIGNECTVSITHNAKGYAKIAGQGGVSGVPNGVTVGALANPTFIFDLENPDMNVFNDLPEFVQNRIKENLDYEDSELANQLNNPAY